MQGSIWVVCYSETGGEDDPCELTWWATEKEALYDALCYCGDNLDESTEMSVEDLRDRLSEWITVTNTLVSVDEATAGRPA